MQHLTNLTGATLWLIQWAAGCVLAKGFWSTLAAACTGGIWSLYLVVERGMLAYGIL